MTKNKSKDMVVVTGGAGFIGSNLVAALEEKGIGRIVVCDIYGSDERWQNLNKRALYYIIHPETLPDYLARYAREIDAVFHMGAISATTERDVDLIVRSNITLSQSLCDWCAENGARFIYASSAATYGDGDQGFKDGESLDHLNSLKPLNAYGWSKNMFDKAFQIRLQNGEAVPEQWAGLKFFNVYGPNEYHKDDMMSVICKLYPQIMDGQKAKLFTSHKDEYEDGGQLRDFVYVKDCVAVMLWLYDNPDVSGLFNVGTGKAQSFKELAEATFKAAGKDPQIEYIPMPEHLREKYQYFTEADMNKLHEAGYTGTFRNLEDGVRDYVHNYMATDDKFV